MASLIPLYRYFSNVIKNVNFLIYYIIYRLFSRLSSKVITLVITKYNNKKFIKYDVFIVFTCDDNLKNFKFVLSLQYNIWVIIMPSIWPGYNFRSAAHFKKKTR